LYELLAFEIAMIYSDGWIHFMLVDQHGGFLTKRWGRQGLLSTAASAINAAPSFSLLMAISTSVRPLSSKLVSMRDCSASVATPYLHRYRRHQVAAKLAAIGKWGSHVKGIQNTSVSARAVPNATIRCFGLENSTRFDRAAFSSKEVVPYSCPF
jgi:hypothetical protein